jgi:hypothetical protein
MLCGSLFVLFHLAIVLFVLFHLAIVLFVLRFMASGYFGTWFWKCYQIYRMYIENIDHFVDEEKVEDTNFSMYLFMDNY